MFDPFLEKESFKNQDWNRKDLVLSFKKKLLKNRK